MKTKLAVLALVFFGFGIQPILSVPVCSYPYIVSGYKVDNIELHQPDPGLEALFPLIEKLGINVKELKAIDDPDGKSCTIEIKGSIGGTPIELVITIQGQSCAEFFLELVKGSK